MPLGIMVTAAAFTDLPVHKGRILRGHAQGWKEKTFGKVCMETSLLNIFCHHLAGCSSDVLYFRKMSADS